ncbi:hypothetical protein [Ralstonia solanacearum]|uniref:hypothetical protein n=1 Tax=Ralstonia solanacearum TaxID=305 RepID=UPI00202A3F11|nr:hypothetical protein [Ralstonia solanacearum]MCL9846036.1 hypothetical protein [Ralstonia solanacearum]MDC6253875.1 hypothetical protein [Ralstonia solanacearum]MDC6258623.1 hypothetical protein [Ralstonia solanacearum]MDC6303356.1 hypothetical protein [Ralstonia solanacearum]
MGAPSCSPVHAIVHKSPQSSAGIANIDNGTVSTFSQTVTIENDHHHHHDRHRELADVMVVMVVTVLLYCFTQQKEGCAPLFPLGVGLTRPACSQTPMPVMVTPAQISTFSRAVTIENDRHHHHNHHREQFGAAVAVVVTALRLRRVFMTQASSSA